LQIIPLEIIDDDTFEVPVIQSEIAVEFQSRWSRAGMTASVEEILASFDHLPEDERRELAYQIIRRTVALDLPPLTDEDLIRHADAIFLEMDSRESGDA